MKNIHILQTDKPSRLFKILQFNFVFDNQNKYSEEYKKLHKYINQNIYITSDEEIKEGDYFLYDKTEIRYKTNGTEYHGRDLCHISGNRRYKINKSKKIILTTNQDLIEEGVQAIDDEFLEWFVKNPSCKEVEVKMENYYASGALQPNLWQHKIIIPQEEPKQDYEYIGECKGNNGNGCFMDSSGHDCGCFVRKLKQETLEEAAEKMYKQSYDEFGAPTWDEGKLFHRKAGFIDGAKWQQKRMYSEEDIMNALHSVELKDNRNYSKIYDGMKEWFEQFKKEAT
jgi:hypothetical protein